MIVVDYGRGNLFSLKQALLHVGGAPKISSDPADLATADKIVFPGVGAFGDAMEGLRAAGLVGPLKDAIARGTPLLGICVGCQLLLSLGEEFETHQGLDVIPGRVALLPRGNDPQRSDRIPNVGWRRIRVNAEDPVLGTLSAEDYVYFVHSFAPYADPDFVAAWLDYNGREVPVAVRRESVLGVQFHPEKSGDAGLRLLEAFRKL